MKTLRYAPADGRPDTVIGGTSALNLAIVVGGVVVAIVSNVVVPFAIYSIGVALDAASEAIAQDDDEAERLLEEEDVIEARFVTLGVDFHDELPNREVPLLDTAPRQPAQTPTDRTPVERAEEREDEEVPPDAVEDDLLRDVLNRSRVFAEIAEEREREGSPDGIEEGTEREGTEGDIYRGRLFSFFHRGWTVPTTLPQEEREGLTTTMDVQIGDDLSLVQFSVRRGSGNALFDQSVTEQLTRLQAGGQHIPPPPEEVASQYIGTSIVVRFSGRQAR